MKKKTETRGRKTVADKKVALRLYVEQSLIDANGGEHQAKEICILSLKSGAKKNKDFKNRLTPTNVNTKREHSNGA